MRGTRRPSASSRRGWESTSRTSPCRAMDPESSTQSVLQCAARSESFCSATTMVTPRALSAERREKTAAELAGSSSPVGSSSARTCGRMASTAAMATFCFCPQERVSRLRWRRSVLIIGAAGKSGMLCCYEARKRVVEHGADDAAQVRGGVLDRVQAADAAGAVEVAGPVMGHRAAQRGEQRGLARAGGAENPQEAAPRHPEREGAQRGLLRARIAEGEGIQLDHGRASFPRAERRGR